ncbi:hypothetical protein CPB84DRAFT_1730312 [Gymnopilus junonius]|uniref:Uncharacterized protein n=1 Tax=Gymnopilus junonius TaxID=109634 RepID=A0A9P5NN46_GYMJU|nr:hypothetical protein CPB84DRAFT_1730312 [Gymnopilus junonius]
MDQPQRSLSPFISAKRPSSEGSLAQSLKCEAKIANLTYRITFLSSFLSTTQQILDFFSATSSSFSLYHEQIITLVELARKTLESAGVVVYSWASCPPELAAHKEAYLRLLRMLQSNQQYVDTQLQRRLRVLLMPLTSHFSTSKMPGSYQSVFRMLKASSDASCSSVSSSPEHTSRMPASHDSASSSMMMMPPPDEFPPSERANNDTHTSNNSLYRRPSIRQLWHVSELVAPRARRHRSVSPHRISRDDLDCNQENVAPDPIPFRQAPTKQRFGIFLTGKSSMLRNQNRKDRSGRPTH